MNIKTKFDVGDRVWVKTAITTEYAPTETVILEILVEINSAGAGVAYITDIHPGLPYEECELFKTKAELLLTEDN